MRSAKVLRPRTSRNATNGLITEPVTPWSPRTASTMSREPRAAPAMRSLWPPRYFVAEWTTTSTPHSSGRWLYGVAKVPSITVLTRCRRPISAKRSRSSTRLYGLVGDSLTSTRVAGRHRRHLDPVPGEGLVEELPRPAVAVVGDHHVGAPGKHREQRRGHRGHAAREQEAVSGALEGGELGLGDALGRIAVPPVLDPLDLAVEVVLQLLGVGKGEGRGLDDRRGERMARLLPRLTGVHRERARPRRVGGRRWRHPVAPAGRRGPLARRGHDTSSGARSTWRAMARDTCRTSAGSSTGALRCEGWTPSSRPMWYAAFWSANLSPFAVEITTTRSLERTTLRSMSLRSAASATPVCGQLNMPVRSARAASSASSCSEACSTTPLKRCKVRMARLTDTGLPIWMAMARVDWASMGSKRLKSST